MVSGQNIKDYLYEHQITQTYLAKKLNIPQTSLSGYLNGKRNIPENVLLAIVNYLNISTDYVYGLTRTESRLAGLTGEEKALVSAYRTLNPEQRQLLAHTAQFMQTQNAKK